MIEIELAHADLARMRFTHSGVAQLWEAPADQLDPLADLIGRTRATLLAATHPEASANRIG